MLQKTFSFSFTLLGVRNVRVSIRSCKNWQRRWIITTNISCFDFLTVLRQNRELTANVKIIAVCKEFVFAVYGKGRPPTNACIRLRVISRWIFIICQWPCIIRNWYDTWNFHHYVCSLPLSDPVHSLECIRSLKRRGGGITFHIFCSCDRDLGPMTFIYKLDPMTWRSTGWAKFESYRLTDRQTNR